MNQRREKLAHFELARPATEKGNHDLRRHPVLIVTSRNARFIRNLRRELIARNLTTEIRIGNEEANVYALYRETGSAFEVLAEVKAKFADWRGKRSKQRTQIRIAQVVIGLLILATTLFQPGEALTGVALLASWTVAVIVGEHVYRRKKWEGSASFTIAEMLIGLSLVAVALVFWRFVLLLA